MRPPRIAILVLFLASSFFLLGRAITSTVRSPSSTYRAPLHTHEKKKATVWGYMYYNTPFSLFPPNAAISLTDDNSTSFAARPAAFGPKLRLRGLSGQLWVGSGFSEETSDTDGELGCSDLPAWDSGEARRKSLRNTLQAATAPSVSTSTRRTSHSKRASGDLLLDRDNRDAIAKSKQELHYGDDSIDDHLSEGNSPSRHETSALHADIQSIQEGAEIEGKVVLLMRGGCGFLDKVMWAQRRGAAAVIVGDNRKGGPLIQMFAHGEEVDNVTIPSVFTARTTAQLLSSLTQPGSFIEDTLDDRGNAILKVQQGSKTKKEPETISTASSKKQRRAAASRETNAARSSPTAKRSWFSRMLWGSSSRAASRRSQLSGGDWVMVEEWNDEKDVAIQDSMDQSKSVDDDFVIGVHDWRDPDLVEKAHSGSTTEHKDIEAKSNVIKSSKASDRNPGDPKSGKVTPGKGEYNPYKALPKSVKNSAFRDEILESSRHSRTLMGKMFGSQQEGRRLPEYEDKDDDGDDDEKPREPVAPGQPDVPHEGLWVTIQPTSSASPFFDTLLVLVISPLVTLTVVYALLILRARIRRRRWRAPKSVVEQLPVRTYHTVAASSTPSPRQPSPSSTSPTTPLLQHSPPRRSRPRSRTTTGIPESDSSLLTPASAIPTPPRTSSRQGRGEHEKGAGGFSAEWKKYMGRQVECVVCLEEYVDGVSRVMSLPCGHEFHADCITPWLTTRRRTCPICKGDVVRSVAHGSSSSPRYDSYHDDSDDDEPSGEASGTRSTDNDSDLEQGILSETHDSRRQDNWMSFWPNSFSSRRSRTPLPPPEDRDR